ncbi:MAG: N-acetylmuramoyl-L-alanine amidase [Oscillospiraceae bacterium]|jgi:N-acetylmuramoyl-L-alanine amidase|nr:N-acetylmuramoyl-L-alanine amidase [Oscillospiraceae bacterium]
MKVFVAKKNTVIFIGAAFLFCIFTITLMTTHAILNKKNANYAYTLILDAGHGGEDGGAVGAGGVVEKNINLDISLKTKELFEIFGAEVIMTREKDKAIYDGEAKRLRQKKRSDLRNRLKIIEKNSDDKTVFVSIHQNKFPDSKYSGTQIFYSTNNPSSEELALSVREKIVSAIQPENEREIKPATSKIFLLNNAKIPAITVECGFISNEEEAKKLVDENYQSQMAMSIFCGVNNFINKNADNLNSETVE